MRIRAISRILSVLQERVNIKGHELAAVEELLLREALFTHSASILGRERKKAS